MEGNKANYAKIGFFIICAMLLCGIALAVAGSGAINRRTVLAETYFTESIAGLDVGSAVKYRGLAVGSVKDMGFVFQTYQHANAKPSQENMKQIMVVMSLDPAKFGLLDTADPAKMLEHLIASGLRVKLSSSGVTGLSYLELDYFGEGQENAASFDWKPEHPFIPSINSTMTTIRKVLDELFAKLNKLDFQKLGEEAEKTVALLNSRLEGLDTAAITSESTNLLAELRQTNAEIHSILSENGLKSLPEKTAVAIGNVSSGVSNLVANISELAQSANSILSTNLVPISESVHSFAETATRTAEESSGAISGILDNLRSMSSSLDRFVKDVSENPSGLLFGRPPEPIEAGD